MCFLYEGEDVDRKPSCIKALLIVPNVYFKEGISAQRGKSWQLWRAALQASAHLPQPGLTSSLPPAHPRVPREGLGPSQRGISSIHTGSDSPGVCPNWLCGADDCPCGTRQATADSFDFGHNLDLWAVCITALLSNLNESFPKSLKTIFFNLFPSLFVLSTAFFLL